MVITRAKQYVRQVGDALTMLKRAGTHATTWVRFSDYKGEFAWDLDWQSKYLGE